MLDWRTLLLGVAAFGATFAGGMWLGAGSLPSLIGDSLAGSRAPPAATETARPAPAPAPPPIQVAAVLPPQHVAAPPVQGPGLTDDDRLRQSVVLRAKAYLKPSCNADPKTLYVTAATKYAEVLMRAAGCSQFPRCPMSPSLLADVWQRNRSPLDQPVAEAMAAVSAAGGVIEKSFRGDVGRAVRVIAGRDFAKGPGPSCQANSQRRHRVRRR